MLAVLSIEGLSVILAACWTAQLVLPSSCWGYAARIANITSLKACSLQFVQREQTAC